MKSQIKLAVIAIVAALAAFAGGATAYYVIDNARQAEAAAAAEQEESERLAAERERLATERIAQPTVLEAYMAACTHHSKQKDPEIYCKLKWDNPVAKAVSAEEITDAVVEVRQRFSKCIKAQPDWGRKLCLRASADYKEPWSLEYVEQRGLDADEVLEICRESISLERWRLDLDGLEEQALTLDINAIHKLHLEAEKRSDELSKDGKCFLLNNRDKYIDVTRKSFIFYFAILEKSESLGHTYREWLKDNDGKLEYHQQELAAYYDAWMRDNGWELNFR